MGLADLHIHTRYSYDATSSVRAVLEYASRRAGLDVIAITDHDEIAGALKAQDMASKFGIEVIPGIEVSSKDGHVLALFVEKAIPAGLSLADTVRHTTEQGGLCIIPHPMMRNKYAVPPHILRSALADPTVAKGLAGIEVFNACMLEINPRKPEEYLPKKHPLAQVGCSDAHFDWAVGWGATRFPGQSASALRLALEMCETTPVLKHPMNLGEFVSGYIPGMIMRYASREA